MNRIALTGLCKIELPSYTIRLCDGGVIYWGAEVYRGRDPTYGAIGSLDVPEEGAQQELPPLELTLLPPSTTAAADLVQPTHQESRVRFWLGEYDIDTSTITGTPTLKFDGELDQASLDLQLQLDCSITPRAARLFEFNLGNSLAAGFHKSIWPGETGHDNAAGLGRPIAWGVTAPPGASTGTASPWLDPASYV